MATAHADLDTWKNLAIAAAIAGGGLWLFLTGLAKSRAISTLPRSLLRSAAQGYVELHGRAGLLPGSSLTAPLSRKPCVWFSYAIEEKTMNGKGNTQWTTVDSGRSDAVFELRDETGHCIVDPRGAEVITDRQDRWLGDSRTPTQGPDATRRWWESGDYRYTEQRIEPHQQLFVWGNFRTKTLRTGVSELLRAWKTDQARLIERFDANRDGLIDGGEWDHARKVAEAEVSATPAPAAAPLDIVDRPVESGRPFILSTRSEASLLRGYFVQLVAGIAMFLLGGTTCVWLLSVSKAD